MRWMMGLLLVAAAGCAHEERMSACAAGERCPGRHTARASHDQFRAPGTAVSEPPSGPLPDYESPMPNAPAR